MYEYLCRLVRVIDGDTVVLDVDLGFKVSMELTCRLYGVDTPERGQPGFGRATSFTKKWMAVNADEDGHLFLTTMKDKAGGFGRYLGVILPTPDSATTESLNYALADNGLAEVYRP